MRAVGQRGSSAVEYLGVLAAVAVLLGGLVTVGEHRVRREAPVDPVAELVRLVTPPVPPRRPRVRPVRPAVPRPRPAPRPPRPERPVVQVPQWAVGGW